MTWELPAPRIVAFEHAEQTRERDAPPVRSYRHVDSILKHGLDRLSPPELTEQLPLALVHEHLRGRDYYQ